MKDIIEAIIEIPSGTKNKYEIDKINHRIKLNRVQYSSMTYPAEYGFIENTLAKDNDPLDILVLTSEPTFPGCVVDARIVGYLMTNDGGFDDQKIIAVNAVDPRYNDINSIDEINHHMLLEIKNFFTAYKVLQNVEVKVYDFHSKEEALQVIEDCKQRYEKGNK